MAGRRPVAPSRAPPPPQPDGGDVGAMQSRPACPAGACPAGAQPGNSRLSVQHDRRCISPHLRHHPLAPPRDRVKQPSRGQGSPRPGLAHLYLLSCFSARSARPIPFAPTRFSARFARCCYSPRPARSRGSSCRRRSARPPAPRNLPCPCATLPLYPMCILRFTSFSFRRELGRTLARL